VSGVRRLRHPQGPAADHAGNRRDARQDGLRVGDRLCRAVPILHGHLWVSHDPWAGAGVRHGNQAVEPRPRCLGCRRRRRHAVDRRQSPSACPAAQRRSPNPDLQQRDLPRANIRQPRGSARARPRLPKGRSKRPCRPPCSRWGPAPGSSRVRSTRIRNICL
jgi:hypothetical protein